MAEVANKKAKAKQKLKTVCEHQKIADVAPSGRQRQQQQLQCEQQQRVQQQQQREQPQQQLSRRRFVHSNENIFSFLWAGIVVVSRRGAEMQEGRWHLSPNHNIDAARSDLAQLEAA